MLNTNIAWSRQAGTSYVTKLFQDVYGYAPDGVWSAPGRVNVIGEHTDYNDGFALPIALPHRAYVAAAVRPDRLFRVVDEYKQVIEIDLDKIGPVDTEGKIGNWSAYLAGVAWALEHLNIAQPGSLPGLDVALRSCVPRGGGLSSSAALECATALAIDEIANLQLAGRAESPNDAGRIQIVTACIEAENKMAGAPTGGLDQSASLRCQDGFALALDCQTQNTELVPFNLAKYDLTLLVIDTQASHSLNDGQYAARRQSCEQSAQKLGVVSLRVLADQIENGDITLADAISKLDTQEEKQRTRHVITEIARTKEIIKILQSLSNKDFTAEILTQMGELLNASHDSLRDDYEVTCLELDLAVDTARANGAYGARMTGGGFGGSAIALIAKADTEKIATAIAEAYIKAGCKAPVFLPITASQAADKEEWHG